jgi:hypothetical protein
MARFRDLYKSFRKMHAASAGLASLEGLAKNAPVAQLDRALDYESRGQEFESLRARHSTILCEIVFGGSPCAAPSCRKPHVGLDVDFADFDKAVPQISATVA